jgi:hypothetical protein
MNDLSENIEALKTTARAAENASAALAGTGITMHEAATIVAEFARLARPAFVQGTRDAWQYLSEERREALAWVWEAEYDD